MTSPSSNFGSTLRLRAPRWLLLAIAVLFCAATSIYALAWMYDQRNSPQHFVEIGFNTARETYFNPKTSSIPVYDVAPNSPAEKAGLRARDEIVGLNGHPLTSYSYFDKVWTRSKPGDPVEILVRRAGEAAPITLHAVFRAVDSDAPREGTARASAHQLLSFYPLFFVVVGFTVLFLRLDNFYSWLLTLLFCSFVTVPSFSQPAAYSDGFRDFLFVYRAAFVGMIAPLFYVFFALFPEKSPLERRAGWLKWVALASGLLQIIPSIPTSEPRLPALVAELIGEPASTLLRKGFVYGFLALGIVSLVWNRFSRETSPEARRKSRVLLFGTLLGVVPVAFERGFVDFSGYRSPFWINIVLTVLLLLYPLAFAYAIVKHRVLEIPALLRNSVRYLLVQRGYFVLLICGGLLAILLFARFFSGYFTGNSQYGMAVSAAFGVALVWFSGPVVRRGTDRIDRAFFRSSYDARIILQDLAEKTRTVTDRNELAKLLQLHIQAALHPKSLGCYFEAEDGSLTVQPNLVPKKADEPLSILPVPNFPSRVGSRFVLSEAPSLSPAAPLLAELAANGKAWDVPPPVADQCETTDALTPECLVPILGRNGKLFGLLVLGPRFSEEPYSSEDKRLLDSVASQAAVSLENMRLAEQIADRLEVDRRVAHEMQIARDVQSRLFPQLMPPLRSLEYAGNCMQARQVGGDYYDFLDLGSSQRLERGATRPLDAAAWHLAFVLADISGKGIAGALLMANLQANLRSRYALALDDLPRLLSSVNQLFYENTPDDRYATLFFCVYDDRSRELEYANCGHNAPLLFRANGAVERLESTSTVIGLFPNWKCETRHVTLQPGDLLVIYTDGVTEANDGNGNEFGESRLIETVRQNRQATPEQLVTRIQEAVQKFSVGEQSDDLTLVIARAR
ncbi:MAG TPA: SpoIIE family protein phosphatase [Dongiaceae bacterium]|nr:SpoIIE family protein phosphatase [Dongiaceae bacterium]